MAAVFVCFLAKKKVLKTFCLINTQLQTAEKQSQHLAVVFVGAVESGSIPSFSRPRCPWARQLNPYLLVSLAASICVNVLVQGPQQSCPLGATFFLVLEVHTWPMSNFGVHTVGNKFMPAALNGDVVITACVLCRQVARNHLLLTATKQRWRQIDREGCNNEEHTSNYCLTPGLFYLSTVAVLHLASSSYPDGVSSSVISIIDVFFTCTEDFSPLFSLLAFEWLVIQWSPSAHQNYLLSVQQQSQDCSCK